MVVTYRPILAEHGEPEMEAHPMGGYVELADYIEISDLLDEADSRIQELEKQLGK